MLKETLLKLKETGKKAKEYAARQAFLEEEIAQRKAECEKAEAEWKRMKEHMKANFKKRISNLKEALAEQIEDYELYKDDPEYDIGEHAEMMYNGIIELRRAYIDAEVGEQMLKDEEAWKLIRRVKAIYKEAYEELI